MKKPILIPTFLMASAFAASAFAVDITTSTTIGGGVFAPSKNVTLKVSATTTSYAATSQNSQGSKQFGTVGGTGVTGDPTKILSKAAVADGPDAPNDSTDIGSGWQ
ncbi:hypothetical protein [Geobacter sp. DSM 9736]|uniref:hypothetical protein n=1 Tax=Geobacter sp. DSM 9736 TaxID=1277350 RepID=UPI000B506CDD|nr:hypothetical protein [Geobacter sp. DSM 9736]SNB45837.1 hypothetical protein SAMN06269301_1266 [Geobacter sp. DSM 9736]